LEYYERNKKGYAMAKGIIYIMTTVVSGLIKIGIAETKQYQERMRHLEHNGYYNVTGLKRYFAIEVEDYKAKEKLLHNVFGKHRVGESELFSLDVELAKELLMAFDGKVIFPEIKNKAKEFAELTKTNEQNNKFSFYNKGLKNGDIIIFKADKSIKATVVGEREVEYLGQTYKLSPLTYKLYEEMGKLNRSGAYQGAAHFEYKGKLLKDLPNIV